MDTGQVGWQSWNTLEVKCSFVQLFRCASLDNAPSSPTNYGHPSIRDGVLRSGMLLYLHHMNFKIFFHPAKFDNFKDEKISEFKTVSVSQRKNLLG